MTGADLVLANVSIPKAVYDDPQSGALTRCDITIRDGLIADIAPAHTTRNRLGRVEHDGGLVLPCFTDMHTHIDKGHIWPRRQNPDGTWAGALGAVLADREANWAAEDVERRMDFSLRCAYAHGTAALRTHLDMAPPQHEISWDVFEKTRDAWAGKIELQGVALLGPDAILDPDALKAVATRTKAAGGVLGGSSGVHPENRTIMLRLVETAGELGLDLDLHTDETGDPSADALKSLAKAVTETGYQGRVTAGHCCVLAMQGEDVAKETIELTAKAGIGVVSLPMCNMYLQDRTPGGNAVRTPRWRGVTLVNELRAAGVPVTIASDNTRDPFYAYGDLDGFEVLREAARITHFDHPQSEAWTWLRAIGADASKQCGFAHSATIAIGQPADLIVFGARNWSELMARPQSNRLVLRDGLPIETSLPDYRELDDLMGARQ
ncbi:amidohydrolase [Devosia pacifica]|uniref:Amidohydrolase n=1 Tax=Devosia pacifica TaxID=1335967 RepID=A0A918SA51_9HYPH|nr:cytosine deaminase [Devosia pacifica]GHA32327.1 amidohydrolase [Devosia pacifica]